MAVITPFACDTAVPSFFRFPENEGQYNANDTIVLQQCFIPTFMQMSSQVAKGCSQALWIHLN